MEIKSITKKYKDSIALNDCSFNFNRGEIIGLIGKNGAGKSTIMKVVTQNIQVYKGTIENNNNIGYLIEEPKLYNNKTGVENLNYFSKIYGSKFEMRTYEKFFKKIGMYDVLRRKVKVYSLGMRQKLGIIISLINNPEFIVLDEPTNGMDIETSYELLFELKNLANAQNIGILISSHNLEDIEQICDRFIFIADGKVVSDQLSESDNNNLIHLEFHTEKEKYLFEREQNLGEITFSENNSLRLLSTANTSEIFNLLNSLGITLKDFSTERNSLRNIYMNKLGGAKDGV
ncbi:ABC transporter ATP-binding protein [Listeria sp. FSL L7-1582]|uniref:ATP-binding cassette domain-containing protein n=1 Tax=Listeria portnoyi TaxID=2713504 RepID=UPI00164D9FD4|nr:ABC transporter ATP-binding protein [Listeria portnoyi]